MPINGEAYHVVYQLKGPKHEIFVAGICTQIRPVWVDDLGTRGQKNQKVYGLGLIFSFLSAKFFVLSATAFIIFIFTYVEKKLFKIASIFTSIGLVRFF